ncbi:hypothetical protein B566_EDAN005213 [Ephemera danica]|nr:hypothetical protein B566_EDAN005213 [Ephemera danica]
MMTAKQPVHGSNEEEMAIHSALETQNGAQVCQLLRSGMHLCCNRQDNCFISIIKLWKCPVLDSALRIYPSAVNCRGAGGDTLPMLCETVEKLQTVLKHKPDLNAINDCRDNLLLHAVKQRLHHFSQTFLTSFLYHLNELDDIDEYEIFSERSNVEQALSECKSMMKCIVTSGVSLDCVDATGETALEVLLNMFKCGHVFTPFHERFDGIKDWHHGDLCLIDNELASHALAQLLKVNATIPPTDEFGRTALMKAAFSPYNAKNMKMMIERGIDIEAKDQNGFNAMFYMLSSFAQHCYYLCRLTVVDKSSDIDEMTAFLLKNGCELQGLDIVIMDPFNDNDGFFQNTGLRCKVLLYLLTIKDSKLNQLDFSQKYKLKNDPEDDGYNFFNLYLKNRSSWWQFEMNDVAILREEISEGTSVFVKWFQQPLHPSEVWDFKLLIPDAIRTLLNLQRINTGALSPGSKLRIAVEKKYKLLAQRFPEVAEVRDHFVSLHLEVPTLHQLSRTALRGSFKIGRTDTEGFDLSSLRIQWQGVMRELPRPIKNFINFKPQY